MPPSTQYPRIVDLHGQLRDPVTGNALAEGQEEPGSIYHVPNKEQREDYRIYIGPDKSIPFSQLMQSLREAGMEAQNLFLHMTPRPEDVDRPPSPPPPRRYEQGESAVEFAFGDPFRTDCAYCWAVIQGKERESGFKLEEIDKAASEGCSTCAVLHRGIMHFSDILFRRYNHEKVRVRQKKSDRSSLLSETRDVNVCFDELDAETIGLTFNGSVQEPTLGTTWDNRILDTSSYSAILKIKEWLLTCSEEHPQCAIPPISTLPVRVLDISNSRAKIIETNGMIAPYVALSHCWGKSALLRLLKSNIEAMKKDIPWTSLSKTFQDSIMIAWKLGFRYIWIDALCILQDSLGDWEYHAARMADIFSKAQLTISASSGADGNSGCFSSRLNEPYIFRSSDLRGMEDQRLWLPIELEGKDRDGCYKTFTVRLKPPHGLYHNRRPKEPLLKRAWVFQEQILSPRIIHFASGELFFECKSHLACECSGWSSRAESYQWETRWRKAHNVLLGKNIQPLATLEAQTRRRIDFEAYRGLIETYMELEITEELDRLPALSGVTFGRKDEYVAGMWKSILLESLHWYAVSKSLTGAMARRPHSYRAPSWSWASMEAPIRHAETDFYRTPHSPKYVAEIIGVSAKPHGQDPRGRVTSGYMRIQGPMGEALVVDIGTCEREGSQQELMQQKLASISPEAVDPSLSYRDKDVDLCTYATLRRDGREGRCYLDLPLALCRTRPAEMMVGQEVLCLILSTRTIMVLVALPDTPRAYTRVGLFMPKDNGWKFDNGRPSIFIM